MATTSIMPPPVEIATSGNRSIRNFLCQYTATFFASAFDYAAPEARVVAEMAAPHREILDALINKHWARARKALAVHIRAQRPVLAQLLKFESHRKPK